MIFVVKMDNPASPDDTGTPTRVRIVGPFNDKRAAQNWANDHNPHDNPCWQLVNLRSADEVQFVEP